MVISAKSGSVGEVFSALVHKGIMSTLLIGMLLASLQAGAQVSPVKFAVPPSMKHPLVPSHGSNLLGVFYLAAGEQPHPTAILFHGFPGYEQNLDLAQTLRRAGWNVLAMHYRGSWGVAGNFSFVHAAEDADAEVDFVLDPKNVVQYRIDPKRIVVIGHSMGGFMAASAAAHNPNISAAVLLSAWNIGAPRPSETDEAKALVSNNNLAPISGTDGPTLAHEEFTHRAQLDMLNLVSAVAARPVLIVTANDGSDQFAEPFAAALRAAGDKQVSVSHFDTDHPYSGYRLALGETVLAFLQLD
jgi:pimeloyl-ACP methyl ester carboxylesterase